uniref:Putative ribonuclease H-like domain-containing protein n=1 Tax=Tanacetum cinerariifolium TaxID=118510 RepID=A0A6L2K622_TANCI|nr:putative ribonuclease H-like domain-containing protein [Tanacetum cinerariifolium]
MEHYLEHTDYPIWEFIQKENGPVQVSTDTNRQIRVLPPKTAEEILARERERKERTTLLMAILEDHLAKFHKMTDPKEMWEAIKSRFSGNDKSKKMQKYLLKQQFRSFLVSKSEGLHKGYDRTKPRVYTLNFDDLYNNLGVFESYVKGSTGSSSSTLNVAFVSFDNTSSTNKVNTAFGVSISSGHNSQKEGSSSYTDDLIECRSKGNQDSRMRGAGNTRYKARDNGKRPAKQDEHKAMVTIDGEGSDTEVTSCLKVCEESYAKLKKLYDEQREQLGVASIEIQAYTLALKKDKYGLGYGSQLHDGVLSYENDFFASVFDSSSGDVENSLVNDRFAKVNGRHAVFPTMTGNYMPLKSDFGIDESKFTYGPKQPKPVESKPKVVNEPKVWSDAPIIEKYVSDSDDEYVSKALVEQEKPTCAFINTVKHVKTHRQSIQDQDTFLAISLEIVISMRKEWLQVELNKQKGKSTGPRENRPAWNNVQRLNHQNKFVPIAVLTKTGKFPVNAARQNFTSQASSTRTTRKVNTARPKVNEIRPRHNVKVNFEDVYFVKELQHFNLFSVSQMCDKKNKVLFTDTECLVLSPGFELPDENQVLLIVHRQHNMYSFNLENIVPSGGLACLIAKATVDESTKWHRSLGHVNFKNLNKLVKENLVRGLPSKIFQNDHTCVACHKGKQHKASAARASSTNYVNTASTPINAASTPLNTARILTNKDDYQIPSLEDISEVSIDGIFTSASYYVEGTLADFTNLETTMNRNKKDERGVVVRNKARLVTQGHIQEEGIDYDDVFPPLARIKAIKIFLAFASYMGFIVYQMDVKSAFLYGKIDEKVYVSQPSGFIDPKFLNKVYKVVKALYDLHQAPKAWYATLSTFLVQSGYRRGLIDKTLFIKKHKKDIMLTASSPIKTKKPLVKDEEAADVDVHLYRSMIGSLMYLTASRPDIMYAVCACSRESAFDLEAYSDSDYAGANLDRKSITRGTKLVLPGKVSAARHKVSTIRVLALETVKDAQAAKIIALKARLKKLEKKCKPSISHHRAWSKSVQRLSKKKRPGDSTVRPDVGTTDLIVPPLTTTSIFNDEDITMAQTLIKMKKEKAKEKGVSIKDIEDSLRPARSILTLNPLPTIDPKDKGKCILEEPEPAKKMTRSDLDAAQIAKDAEVARLVYEEELAELEKEKEKRQKEEEASKAAIAEIYDEVQAGIKADALFVAKLQQKEREEYIIEERAKFFDETITAQRKFRAAQRSAKIRSRPPTKSKVRNLMMTYIKNMGCYKYSQLNAKTFVKIQGLYERQKRVIDDFKPIDSDDAVGKEKVLEEPDNTKIEELKFYHLDRHGVECISYIIFRSDGSSRWIKTFTEMVTRFDRMDFEELYNLVMQRFETTSSEGVDLVLWGDLRTMFKETTNNDLWKNQEEWILKSWNFYENCRVHTLTLKYGTEIYMLAERRYPLTKETLERMLALRLIAECKSEALFDLLRFIQKQIDESGSHDGSEKDLSITLTGSIAAAKHTYKVSSLRGMVSNGSSTISFFISWKAFSSSFIHRDTTSNHTIKTYFEDVDYLSEVVFKVREKYVLLLARPPFSRKEVSDRGGATSWLGSSLIANSVARNFLTLMRKSVRLLKEVINLESLQHQGNRRGREGSSKNTHSKLSRRAKSFSSRTVLAMGWKTSLPSFRRASKSSSKILR